MTNRQPGTNDFRKRTARPLYVCTFWDRGFGPAEDAANDFSELVTDLGGEVVSITAGYSQAPLSDDAAHYRTVTYRNVSRITPEN